MCSIPVPRDRTCEKTDAAHVCVTIVQCGTPCNTMQGATYNLHHAPPRHSTGVCGMARSACGRRTAQDTAHRIPHSTHLNGGRAAVWCAHVYAWASYPSFTNLPTQHVMRPQRRHAPKFAVRNAWRYFRPLESPLWLSFNACKEVIFNAPHNIQHTTHNSHSPSRATKRLHRTVRDTGGPHHATCNTQHIATYSGSHTTHTLLVSAIPTPRGMQHRGGRAALITSMFDTRHAACKRNALVTHRIGVPDRAAFERDGPIVHVNHAAAAAELRTADGATPSRIGPHPTRIGPTRSAPLLLRCRISPRRRTAQCPWPWRARHRHRSAHERIYIYVYRYIYIHIYKYIYIYIIYISSAPIYAYMP